MAYLPIVPETSKIAPGIKKALGDSTKHADAAGTSMGTKITNGLGKTLKTGAIGVGVAAGGVLAASITKGIGRLTSIEDAEAKLSGLGNSATTVASVMDNAMASVKGTAFGLDEAATTAAGAVAAGIKPGQELERILKLTGDAATIAGIGMSDMGSIFNKVATSNKIQGDTIDQLNEHGIPIVQMLAKELGKSGEEVVKLASDGKINFASFANAMETGLGGAALKSGETVSGSFRNMGAAMSRFGAAVAGPLFGQAAGGFGFLTESIDKATTAVKPFAAEFGKWLNSDGVPKLKELGTSAKETFDEFRNSEFVTGSFDRLSAIFGTLADTAQALAPSAAAIAVSLATASAATGVSAWQLLLSTVEAIAPILDATLVPALQTVSGLMQDNQGAVTALMLGFLAFKTLPALVGGATSALTPLKNALSSVGTSTAGVQASMSAMGSDFRRLAPEIGTTGAAMRTLGTHSATVRGMQDAFIGASTAAGGFASAARVGVTPAVNGLKTAASALVGAVGGPLNAALMVGAGLLISWRSGVAEADASAKRTEQSIRKLGEAQEDLQGILAKNGGKFDTEAITNLGDQVENVTGRLSELGTQDAKWWNVASDMIGDVVRANRGASDDISFNMDKVAQKNKDAAKAIEDTGLSAKSLAVVISGNQGNYNSFRASLDTTTEGGRLAAEEMDKLRAEALKARDAALNSTPGMYQMSEAMGVLAEKTGSATSKADALYSSLVALGVIKAPTNEALASHGKKIDDVVKGANSPIDPNAGVGRALFNADGSLRVVENANARALAAEVAELGKGYLPAALASGDADKTNAQLNPARDALANRYGVKPEEVNRLLAEAGVQPRAASIAISVEGGDDVAQEIGAITTGLAVIDPGKPKVITLTTDQVSAQTKTFLEGAGATVENIPGTKNVKITAKDEGTVPLLEAVLARAHEVGGINAVPNISLNDVRFQVGTDQAKGILAALDGTTVSPEAQVTIDKLVAGKAVASAELLALRNQVTDPEVKVLIDKALADARVINKALDDAARTRRAEIVPSLAGQVASGQINLGQAMSQLYPPIQRATGGPVSGPGTGTSDSIPAMLSNGEHVLTASDVAKAGGHGAVYRLRQAIQNGWAHFATGGAVGRAIDAARSVTGNKYDWGGTGPTNFDCSGFVGWLQQILMGIEGSTKRLYTTYSLIDGNLAGLVPGLNPNSPFNVGVSQEHMAATLAGQNVESGGANGTSGIGSDRAGAADSQFPYKFHLPTELIPGFTADDLDANSAAALAAGDRKGFGGAANADWTEADNLALQDARVAIEQAREDRDRIRADANRSDSDRQDADLKLARAEQKVHDLESRRDSSGIKAMSDRSAPALAAGGMTDESMELRNAEIAVTEAQLSRDQAYASTDSTSLDLEQADMAVYSAQNRLDEVRKRLAEGEKSDEPRLKSFTEIGSDLGGILAGGLLETFGLQDSILADPSKLTAGPDTSVTGGYTTRDLPKAKGTTTSGRGTAVVPNLPSMNISTEEAMTQLPITPGPGGSMADWIRRFGLPFDQGGLATGLGFLPKATIRPERVLSPEMTPIFDRFTAQLEAGASVGGGSAPVIHIEVHGNANTAEIERVVDRALRRNNHSNARTSRSR
ncbi:tape measure protein [Rhodococcus triatomae]|nr:hypothetical protein G419_25332 [Rhodococcus triatomae BKS 15-14]